jgi:hypothetical protein
MAKRLYNEYSAAPYSENLKPIDLAVRELVEKSWAWREEWDICPRDLNAYIKNEIDAQFAYHILKRAFKMKKSKDKQND